MTESFNNTVNNTQSTMIQPQPSTSYANVTKSKNTYPIYAKRDQAIVMNSVNGIKIRDYIRDIGTKIGPKNVDSASRISNDRVCIYLTSKQLVDELLQQWKTIEIQNNIIEIRRLVSPTKKLILSNVHPCVHDKDIETALENCGIRTVSSIRFIKAGMQDPEYSHIKSFRRQVYIAVNENQIMPNSLLVESDGMHRIFLAMDNMTCFVCHTEGHTAAQCPQQTTRATQEENIVANNPENIVENVAQQPQKENSFLPPKQPTQQITQMENLQILTATENKENDDQEQLFLKESEERKRHASSSTVDSNDTRDQPTNTETDSDHTERGRKPSKPKNKKPRGESPNPPIPIDELLTPCEAEIESNPNKYVMTYDQLKDFLENAYGQNDVLTISKDYTEDTVALLKMLNQIYPILEHRSIKSRLTRLMTKLKSQLIQDIGKVENSSLPL